MEVIGSAVIAFDQLQGFIRSTILHIQIIGHVNNKNHAL
jgi:hypothetical protein